jgi:predicted  nucleic acid-binding Zn-ribbon protein
VRVLSGNDSIQAIPRTLNICHHNQRLAACRCSAQLGRYRLDSIMSLQVRIKQIFSPHTQRSSEHVEDAASIARRDRAGSITQLQNDVHRLQHEIAGLSQQSESDLTAVDKSANDKHIDALQKELGQTQQSLAKLQGRV